MLVTVDSGRLQGATHATHGITLDLFGFSTAETSLVDQIWKILFHEFIDFGDGLLETIS